MRFTLIGKLQKGGGEGLKTKSEGGEKVQLSNTAHHKKSKWTTK